MGPLHAVIGLVTGGVPVSKEPGKAKRPYERSKEITQKACAKAAAVSGTLALPVGPCSRCCPISSLFGAYKRKWLLTLLWRLVIKSH